MPVLVGCAVLRVREAWSRTTSGGFGVGETPLPIPNRAVKPHSADGTWPSRAWESRSPPVLSHTSRPRGGSASLTAASRWELLGLSPNNSELERSVAGRRAPGDVDVDVVRSLRAGYALAAREAEASRNRDRARVVRVDEGDDLRVPESLEPVPQAGTAGLGGV